MKAFLQLSLAVATLLAAQATGLADQKSHRKAAEELLKSMNVEKQLQSAIDQMIDLQAKANPQLAAVRDVMKKFMTKHMSWAALKEDMITIYTDAFSEAELKQITAFYQTPVGKKMVEKMPELTAKGMQLGVSRVQANQAELRKMLEEARNKPQ